MNCQHIGSHEDDKLHPGTINLSIWKSSADITKDKEEIKNSKKPLKKGRREKFQPKFMVFGLMTYQGCLAYFHRQKKTNKRRSKNEDGIIVKKYHFEHEIVGQTKVNEGAAIFVEQLKKLNINLLIGNCDAKLHAKLHPWGLFFVVALNNFK